MRINKLLIKNVQLEGTPVDIYIEGDTIMQVAPQIEAEANTLIDGTDKKFHQPKDNPLSLVEQFSCPILRF